MTAYSLSPDRIQFLYDFAVSGDSLLVWPSTYFGPTDTLFSHILSTDGGSTWSYPYSTPHPPAVSWSGFGAYFQLEIKDGDIYTLNDGSDAPYNGIVRWDGQQWHSYGNGLYGTYAQATNFEFYKDELYLAGSFSKEEDSRNPGGLIAKWNGYASGRSGRRAYGRSLCKLGF
ncbi:MAG: hypothetical protein U5L96_13485 [Owenweeksia sp.]|nr:hypothetical protein [Owenweeksia sp.]